MPTSVETMLASAASSQMTTAEPHLSIPHCLSLMTDKHIRHLPVVDQDGTLVGMLSIGDLVEAMIEHRQKMIEQLQEYISG